MTATGFTSVPVLDPMKSDPSPTSSQVRPTKCSCAAVVSSAMACRRGLRGLRPGCAFHEGEAGLFSP